MDGYLAQTSVVQGQDDTASLTLEVGPEELDIVLLKSNAKSF